MSNIKERVIQLIEYKKVVKEIFFKKIGTTSANFRSTNKKTPLNSDTIDNLLSEFPDVNAEWLITGKGEMLKKENAKVDQNELEDLRKRIGEQSMLIDMLKEKLNAYEHKESRTRVTAK